MKKGKDANCEYDLGGFDVESDNVSVMEFIKEGTTSKVMSAHEALRRGSDNPIHASN